MVKIKLLDLDMNLDDSFQLVELSDKEPTAIIGGAAGAVAGYVGGWGGAFATGTRDPLSLVGAGLWGAASGALGGALVGGPAAPVTAALSIPK